MSQRIKKLLPFGVKPMPDLSRADRSAALAVFSAASSLRGVLSGPNGEPKLNLTPIVEGSMNSIRSRLGVALIAAICVTLPARAAFAQQVPATTTVRAVLGVASLLSVVDAPLFFKLSKVELAPGQTTKYVGPVGFLYVLSGSLAVQTDAGERSLQQDDALLVNPDHAHSLSASGSQPPLFLHFVLARPTELDRSTEQPPAMATELYRTPRPIPDLKPGRYEFTLTRVSYPRMAPNPPHYRSGAALYYVRSGSGIFLADGKTETKEAGTAHFEPQGWMHQWANNSDAPLVLLQANISEEGVPAVIVTQPPASGPAR